MRDVLDLIILKAGKRAAIVFARFGSDTAIALGNEFNEFFANVGDGRSQAAIL